MKQPTESIFGYLMTIWIRFPGGAVVAIYRFLKNPSNVGIRLHEIVTGLTVGRLTGDLPIEWLFRSRLPEAADVDIN